MSQASEKSSRRGARKFKSISTEPPIDSVIVLEQIDAFVRITTRELVDKIPKIQKLLDTEVTRTNLLKKYSMSGEMLELAFPPPNTRDEIDAYSRLYNLGTGISFLFPGGKFASNSKLDALMSSLRLEFEDLYEKMFECTFALQLLVAPVDRRDMFDHSFLESAIAKFAVYEEWASGRLAALHAAHLNFYGAQVLEIARHPQLEDLRVAFRISERNLFCELIDSVKNLFGIYLKLIDYLDKNQEMLNVLLTRIRGIHAKRIKGAGN